MPVIDKPPKTATAIPHIACADKPFSLTLQKAGSTMAETFIGEQAKVQIKELLRSETDAVRSEILTRMQADSDIGKALRNMENPFDVAGDDAFWKPTKVRLAEIRQMLTMPAISTKQRRELEREAKKLIHGWHRKIEHMKKDSAEERERIARYGAALDDLTAWLNLPLELQRLDHSAFHQLRRAPYDGDLFASAQPVLELIDPAVMEALWGDCEVFVVEHDWARAFERATGLDAGAVTLPHDVCAFEMKFSGRHVVATVFAGEGADLVMLPVVRAKCGAWFAFGTVCVRPDGAIGFCKNRDDRIVACGDDLPPFENWTNVRDSEEDQSSLIWTIYQQVRCALIALSAEVARKEIVRLPWKSNRPPPAAIRQPTYSYHVISLARRERAAPAPRDPGAEPRARRRLHFRRAHDRHYQNHITKIAWMLVGDPELGWVDKHYKL